MAEKKNEVDHFAAGFGAGLISQTQRGSLLNILGTAIVASEAQKVLSRSTVSSAGESTPGPTYQQLSGSTAVDNTPIKKTTMTVAERILAAPVILAGTLLLWAFAILVYGGVLVIAVLFALALYYLIGWWCVPALVFFGTIATL